MVNALRFLYGHCCKPSAAGDSDSLPPHGVVATTAGISAPAQGAKFEFHTLPVDARRVTDGDGITVYVSTSDPRESCLVPQEVQIAAVERSEARAQRDYTRADAQHKSIVNAGYRHVILMAYEQSRVSSVTFLLSLHKGIDAPEGQLPYGNEANEELAKNVQGKCLRVLVYEEDQYGRLVGDIHCNGIFVQELMLKRGMAWHYTAYSQRAEFAEGVALFDRGLRQELREHA